VPARVHRYLRREAGAKRARRLGGQQAEPIHAIAAQVIPLPGDRLRRPARGWL
jgi:hypothetical protein